MWWQLIVGCRPRLIGWPMEPIVLLVHPLPLVTTKPEAFIPPERLCVDVLRHALDLRFIESGTKGRLRLWRLFPCEGFRFSKRAVYVGKSVGCPPCCFATVQRCQRFLEVDLGGPLATKDARNGGLELLGDLPLHAPSACRVLD